MLKQHLLRPTLAVWIVSLIVVSLGLTACGAAAEPTDEVSTPTETEEAVPTPTEKATATEEQQATATEELATEESPTEEAEAANDENLSAPDEQASTEPSCQAVNPVNDPLAVLISFMSDYIDGASPNTAIAAVTDEDWVKGPADAPVTFIEYSDFQ